MTQTSLATVIGTFTPKTSGVKQIQFTAETTFDEEEILGEPQPAKERGRRAMADNGVNSTVMLRYASNGIRDCIIFDSPEADKLIGWAQQNPTIFFDFQLRYQRDLLDASSIRVHEHLDCFIENTPIRTISNEIFIIKFTLNYGKIQLKDGNGVLIENVA